MFLTLSEIMGALDKLSREQLETLKREVEQHITWELEAETALGLNENGAGE